MSTYNALVTKLVIIFTLSPVSGILSLIQQRLQCCLSLCSLYLALETQELVKYEDASAVFVCGFELINYSSLQQQRKLQQNTITFVSICACHGSYCLMWYRYILQAAYHYCACMGFKPFMYKGLETGSRQVAEHAVKQNDVSLSICLSVCLFVLGYLCVCVCVCTRRVVTAGEIITPCSFTVCFLSGNPTHHLRFMWCCVQRCASVLEECSISR